MTQEPRKAGIGRSVSVVGLGASGDAAARLALAKGVLVYVTDSNTNETVTARGALLRDLGADVRLGEFDVEKIASSDTIVVSPGIAPDAPVLRALRERGLRWISEPEFAVRFFRSPLIAVTGTNGKTTTAAWTAHLLREAGVTVALGGNIGSDFGPPASLIALEEPAPQWIVLELSSFQLADIETLRPDVGVLTNLGTDHLDRYASLAEYHADKAHLFDNADADCRWIVNHDDEAAVAMSRDAPGVHYGFSVRRPVVPGGFLHEGQLSVDFGGGAYSLVRVEDLALLGRHNAANALAASLAALATGVPLDLIRPGLRTFEALPHRLEPVARRDGVTWVNDSKATNVGATQSAVESLEGPIVLLLGGKDKGEDFRQLAPSLLGKVRLAVVYGAAGRRIESELEADLDIRRVDGGFVQVVTEAAKLAQKGDVLLLSPACSSFDMFENYIARGDQFRALAQGEVT